jgi:hypothetical protein
MEKEVGIIKGEFLSGEIISLIDQIAVGNVHRNIFSEIAPVASPDRKTRRLPHTAR